MSIENTTPPPHPYPNVGQAVGLMIAIIGITLALFFASELVLTVLPQHLQAPETFRSFVDLVLYTLALVLALRVGLRRRASSINASRPVLKLTRVSASILLVICLMTAALGFILKPLLSLIPSSGWLERMMGETNRPNLANFALVVLAAPVLEEFLVRGVILDGFLKNYRPSTAIAASAAMFALLHLNAWGRAPVRPRPLPRLDVLEDPLAGPLHPDSCHPQPHRFRHDGPVRSDSHTRGPGGARHPARGALRLRHRLRGGGVVASEEREDASPPLTA